VEQYIYILLGLSTGMFLGSLYIYNAERKMRRDRRQKLKEKYGYRVGEAIWKGSSFQRLKSAVKKKENHND